MSTVSNSYVWILKHEDGLLEINEIEGIFGSEEKAKAELDDILKNYPEDIREDKRDCFNVIRMEVR